VGRPSTNALAAKLAHALPVQFGPSSFVFRSETYAHEKTSIIAAGPRPDDPGSSLVVFAGLSAGATWRCVEAIGTRGGDPAAAIVLAAGQRPVAVGSIESPERPTRAAAR
ncbi:MAG: hypothetical protein AB7I30_09390, partial [Isosphaeraceae bacterium]